MKHGMIYVHISYRSGVKLTKRPCKHPSGTLPIVQLHSSDATECSSTGNPRPTNSKKHALPTIHNNDATLPSTTATNSQSD